MEGRAGSQGGVTAPDQARPRTLRSGPVSVEDSERFAGLTFDDFRRMAGDESLSDYERIGFPDEYRAGSEERIFEDIVAKLPALSARGATVLDIGPGSSGLPKMVIERCEEIEATLVLVDSEEMLARLPDSPGVAKLAARFPDCPELFERFAGTFDAILTYSVLQHVFLQSSVGEFLDGCLELLAHEGTLLIGDVPNVSMRKRFLASPQGLEFHRSYSGSDEPPDVSHDTPEPGRIDDSVVLGLLARARAAGADAYVVPQPADLPLANRREDILVYRP
jgi:2-polyprenyl-3-methyl-5-hydroxy-6-metoxy-1,4-benzoquinol methylase